MLRIDLGDVADRAAFILGPDDWRAFCAALDAPARDLPELRRLLTEPTVFDARFCSRGAATDGSQG